MNKHDIHATAVIAAGARLGENVQVGPYCTIEDNVEVGDGCVLAPSVHLCRGLTLGAGCRVHAGAVLGDAPQDLAYDGAESFVKIGAHCVLREGVTVHRGTRAGTVTQLGDGCYLMACSHVAHNCRLGNKVILANGALLGGYAEIGDGAFVSGNVLIHQFVRVGRLAMLGGGCGLSKDVPPFCMAQSLAPNTLLGLNTVGLRRAGVRPDERADLRRAYRLLFRSGFNVHQGLAAVRAAFQSPMVLELCDFIETSKRGICGAAGSSVEEGAAEA